MPSIVHEFDSDTYRTETELDHAELYAIGRVTANWAYLEHGVYAVSYAIANAAQIPLPEDTLHTSFKRRLKALRLLVEKCAPDSDKSRMLSLMSKIANAEQDRHKITHGMWDCDPKDPERIEASSFRPGFEFEKRFNAAKINKLADTIGQISFALEYPGGIADVYEDWADESGRVAYVSTSRRLLRELKARKGQGRLAIDPVKPQKG